MNVTSVGATTTTFQVNGSETPRENQGTGGLAAEQQISGGGSSSAITGPAATGPSAPETPSSVLEARLAAGELALSGRRAGGPNRGSIRSALNHLARDVKKELRRLSRELDPAAARELEGLVKDLRGDLKDVFKRSTGVGEGPARIDADVLVTGLRDATGGLLQRAEAIVAPPAESPDDDAVVTAAAGPEDVTVAAGPDDATVVSAAAGPDEPVADPSIPAGGSKEGPLSPLADLIDGFLARILEPFAAAPAASSPTPGLSFEITFYAKVSVIGEPPVETIVDASA